MDSRFSANRIEPETRVGGALRRQSPCHFLQPFLLRRQGFVCQTAAIRVHERFGKPLAILRLAVIEPEHLLIQVPIEVLRSRSDVRAAKCSPQNRPKVFDAVGVNASADVCDRVIDNLVNVPLLHTAI